MKVALNIRHRPTLGESIQERFERVESFLRKLGPPWGLLDGVPLSLPPVGTRLATHVKLRNKLGKGFAGDLSLRYRSAANLHRSAASDDFLLVEFNASKVAWTDLATKAMPCYVEAMEAYIAGMSLWDSMPSEWRQLSAMERATGKNLDGRDGVFRFGPLTYMDAEICRLSCDGLSPKEVATRLNGVVPEAKLLCGGVLIVGLTAFPDESEIARVDRLIRAALKLPPLVVD